MSKNMKLIMESFRGFAKEIQKENLNETNDWLFLIHQALGSQEDENWGPPSVNAKKLLSLDPAQRKKSLEPWLVNQLHKDALARYISDSDLEEELRSITTGAQPVKEPVKEPVKKPKQIEIPQDDPPSLKEQKK